MSWKLLSRYWVRAGQLLGLLVATAYICEEMRSLGRGYAARLVLSVVDICIVLTFFLL